MLVLGLTEARTAFISRIVDVDHERPAFYTLQGAAYDRTELAVRQQNFRLAVVEHERDCVRIEPRVERVENGACHRDTEVRLIHRRDIRQHRSDRVAAANSLLRQSGS